MNDAVAPAADLAHFAALDARLLEAVRGIRVLSAVSWPASRERKFLDALAGGRETVPKIEYARRDLSEQRAELEKIANEADASHPMGDYLRRSACSWGVAAQMLEALGTDRVTAHSIELYGRPQDTLPGGGQTNLDAAHYFLPIAEKLGDGLAADTDDDENIPAQALCGELQREVDAFFGAGVVRVELDAELTAKAAAGASRIRLRASTAFSAYDRSQLLAHEAFIHTLTALNGGAQPVLKSLSRTSPRATATQEGLAVFAELMSGSMDIARLKRISLRILAIERALQGADFIEVFRFFREHGQGARDSFTSAQRVFRGVPLGGGAAFTKDNVYLAGLLTVHTFFRWAFKRRRLDLLHYLFAGKFALDDVIRLAPCFAEGSLCAPKYLPPWVRSAHGLAGKLAFSLFANRIRMGRIGEWD
jgi:uncharacterized protein (TIGR02421 family)